MSTLSRSKLAKPTSILDAHTKATYRTPTDLTVSTTPIRVLFVGSCLLGGFLNFVKKMSDADFFLLNNLAPLPDQPPRPLDDYAFQVVQVPARSVVPVFNRIGLSDLAGYERLFAAAEEKLRRVLRACMKWNEQSGIVTFVQNFMAPQQALGGRLLPRYDLRNSAYFVERLNESLEREVRRYRNAYIFDADQISSTFGRRYSQDDSVWVSNHGAFLSDADYECDQNRIEPIARATRHYTLRKTEFFTAAWAELIAMYRTVQQADSVKLVIVDLDDTLWRGIAAEETETHPRPTGGWPLGLMEALYTLKQRGVLLAIASKNDEEKIKALWPSRVGKQLRLEDFAVRKINWRPKAENIREILQEVNLLPKSVVFIDDNPVERAAVGAVFPELRMLGQHPYYLRRVLLWSSETQVAGISTESAQRTEMVQAQIARDGDRDQMSREQFLATLEIKVTRAEIRSSSDPAFARAFELINKTNQFNTTGVRWTAQQCDAAFAAGTTFHVLHVEDHYTSYGLVGVAIVAGACIEQFVMSCRVIGLDVEVTALREVFDRIWSGAKGSITAKFRRTPANQPCQDLYQRLGFVQEGDTWILHGSSAERSADVADLVAA